MGKISWAVVFPIRLLSFHHCWILGNGVTGCYWKESLWKPQYIQGGKVHRRPDWSPKCIHIGKITSTVGQPALSHLPQTSPKTWLRKVTSNEHASATTDTGGDISTSLSIHGLEKCICRSLWPWVITLRPHCDGVVFPQAWACAWPKHINVLLNWRGWAALLLGTVNSLGRRATFSLIFFHVCWNCGVEGNDANCSAAKGGSLLALATWVWERGTNGVRGSFYLFIICQSRVSFSKPYY